jgi:hypothetical protein
MILYTTFQNLTQEYISAPNLNRVESWQEFASEIITPHPKLADIPKERLPLFACYHLKSNKRANDQVELVSAIVLDYDNKSTDPTERSSFSDFYDLPFEHVIFSTYSHTPEKPRFRVVIPLEKPIAAKDYFYCLADILEYCPIAGLDPCCKTISQAYYVPTPSKYYQCQPQSLDDLGKKPFFEFCGEACDLSILDKLKVEIKTTVGSTEYFGRNDRLKTIAWAMLERSEPQDVIINELVKIDSAHSIPLFSDRAEKYCANGRNLHQAAEKFLDNIAKSFERVKPVSITTPATDNSVFEYQEAVFTPKNLLDNAPDNIKFFADYFNKTSPVINPNYAVGAAIAFLSIIKNREVVAQNGVFVNSYLGLVGGSSSGKSVMAEQVSDVLSQCFGQSSEIGSPTSGAAVGRALAANNSCGWIRWEEFAMATKSAFGKNAQSYEMSLMSTLMQLFDSTKLKSVPLRTYADPEKNKNIELSHPFLTILGTSTEADVTNLLSSSNVASGYLPRWIFINGDGLTEKKASYTASLTVDKKIKDYLQKKLQRNKNVVAALNGDLDPFMLKFDDEAHFSGSIASLQHSTQDDPELAQLQLALTGKAPVLLAKIAACSAQASITPKDVDFAALVLGESYRYLTYLIDQHAFKLFKAGQERQSEYKLTERILAVLERNKGTALEFDAIRGHLKIRKQSLVQALRYLSECDLIITTQQIGGGRPRFSYQLK